MHISTSPGKRDTIVNTPDQSSPTTLLQMKSSPNTHNNHGCSSFAKPPTAVRPAPALTSNGYVTHDAIMSKVNNYILSKKVKNKNGWEILLKM